MSGVIQGFELQIPMSTLLHAGSDKDVLPGIANKGVQPQCRSDVSMLCYESCIVALVSNAQMIFFSNLELEWTTPRRKLRSML